MKKFKTYFSKAKLIIPFFLISLFFANAKSFSQEIYQESLQSRIEKSKKIVQESTYIFQGKYVSQSVQHTSDRNLSIIQIVLLVEHLYKGELKIGTVIIEQRKFFPHEYLDTVYENGKLIVGKIYIDASSHSRNNDYLLDRSAIFFCKAKNSSYAFNDTIDNKQILEFADSWYSTANLFYNESKGENVGVVGLQKVVFQTKTDFHKFLFESDSDIMLPPSARERAKRDSLIFMNRIERRNKTLDSLRREFSKPSIDGKGKLMKKIGNINYSITNQQLTSTATERFLEFDVYAQVNQTNTFFETSFLTLNYNTAVFGNDVGINNVDIITTKGPSFGSNYILSTGNLFTNGIAFDFYYSYSQTQPRYQLPTTPVLLFHVKIKIKPSNCGSNPSLAFSNLQSLVNQSAYNNLAFGLGTLFNYTNVNTSAISAFTIACPAMTISTNLASIPDIIAGNKKFITITGTNFGTDKGKVLFKDANIGGVDTTITKGYLRGLESSYITWTNTRIIVEVPSYVKEGYRGEDYGNAGSGPIKIKNAYGDSIISSSSLTIKSSYINKGDFLTKPPVKRYNANIDCINGLVFTLHTSFQAKPAAITAVETALQRWSTLLGITLLLEKNANNTIRFVSTTSASNRNVIFFGNGITNGMITRGRTSFENCSNPRAILLGADIEIAANATWYYDINNDVPANEFDFFHGILHEIGHTIGLDHDINPFNGPRNLMHFAINAYNTPVAYTNRPNFFYFSQNAKNAAFSHLTDSKNITWCGFNSSIRTLSNTNSSIKFLTINTNPLNTATLGCGINSITLLSTEATNNEWSKDGSIISTNPSVPINTEGLYTLRNRNSNCSVASLPVSLRIRTVICVPNDPPNPNFTFYPNPTNTNLTVNYDLSGYQVNSKALIQVIDILGKVVFSTELNNENRFIDLELPEVANGIYNISILVDDAIVSSKLLTIQK